MILWLYKNDFYVSCDISQGEKLSPATVLNGDDLYWREPQIAAKCTQTQMVIVVRITYMDTVAVHTFDAHIFVYSLRFDRKQEIKERELTRLIARNVQTFGGKVTFASYYHLERMMAKSRTCPEKVRKSFGELTKMNVSTRFRTWDLLCVRQMW